MTKNKYKNRKTEYNGILYDSKFEAETARKLDLLKRAENESDRVEHWDRQIYMPLIVNGEKVCTIVIDFYVRYADGRSEFIECKNKHTMTSEWKIKMKLFTILYKEHVYRVITNT